MRVTIECPVCKKTGEVNEQNLPAEGIFARCRSCGNRIQINLENIMNYIPRQKSEQLNDATAISDVSVSGITDKIEVSSNVSGASLNDTIVQSSDELPQSKGSAPIGRGF